MNDNSLDAEIKSTEFFMFLRDVLLAVAALSAALALLWWAQG